MRTLSVLTVAVKYDFSFKLVVSICSGITKKVIRWANGRAKWNKDKTQQVKEAVRTKGEVCPEFISKHRLTTSSKPHEYMNIILPFGKNISYSNDEEGLSFHHLLAWINLKANLANTGDGGSCYHSFTPFSPMEIRKHVGLYLLKRLNLLPRVEMKFRLQTRDPIHGNNFVVRTFKKQVELRHRHFKAFFACQNPAIHPPPRKKYPNWKVRPLIKWMNSLFPLIWRLGAAISIDEMTIGFKGNHIDKRCIT